MLESRLLAWLAVPVALAACHGGSTGSGGGGSATASETATTVSTSVGFGTGAGGGCGFGGADDAGNGCAGVVGGVRFSTDVEPILAGCTGEICHGALSWEGTVGVMSAECCESRMIVKPGDVSHSYLADKIHGHHLCGGAQMPLGLPPVSATDEQTLVRWICEGAPND